MELPAEPIYLDFDQCEHFQVEYRAAGTKVLIAADTVLRSKAQGYDEEHRALLEPLGQRTLCLEGTGNGWFKIAGIV